MERTRLSVAILTTLLTARCSQTALMPDQTKAVGTSSLFGARASAGLVASPTAMLFANVKSYLDQKVAGYPLINVEN